MELGNVLLWRHDLKGALAEFARMIALDPNFAQGHTATGLALMYAGEPARALEPFAIAMRGSSLSGYRVALSGAGEFQFGKV